MDKFLNGMSRLLKSRRFTLAILVAVFSMTSIDARAEGYLPRIGPAPLRFALAKPIHPHILALSPLPDDSRPADPIPPILNAAPSPVQGDTNTAISFAQTPDLIPGSTPMPRQGFVPADNMLTITPTMLNEFFKPGGGATNQAPVDVVLPEQMNFQPPAPRDMPSSSATYKSQ